MKDTRKKWKKDCKTNGTKARKTEKQEEEKRNK